MKILFDANGGDNAPFEIVKGAIDARNELGVEIALIGNENAIKSSLDELNETAEIVNATENIENNEEPAFALRKKKNSSTVIGLSLLKEKKYDAFISAGSTGALLAGGLFIVGRIENVKRAVLPTSIPNLKGSTLVIDSGANMDCSEDLLLQFAKMGDQYLKINGIENPRIGLLNVGVEEHKGNSLTKAVYPMLKESGLNFVGNVEARDISLGVCDLVVCDGFVGNVMLKNTEGTAYFVSKALEKLVAKSNLSQETLKEVGSLMANAKKSLDYSEVGGAILLGIKEIVIKAHGSSDSKAIKNAAKQAMSAYETKIIDKIEEIFSR
ncbi:phosphate:acyl-[acyl carrier protein] acyltransferase [Peptoniphilus asaccharolyticus DSM 20463]|uniref:Phosphate acyltransferase n=1 Tax=Peptoniphilus asaccharolyticus DSM 20463 TaxID=573058 RepID=A0A1W1UTF4_PEPAS|nr:phosphate acyltransferase PlsX [Peptoniphilus asaccharolyticus]MBL7575162.1 phosphate acyltransferase PlsX [Peptoniphilus asaccharolyticus]SMB84336.1 phosphate:acyl-[acyl carrier protein] acyltransferase [Peptoniphilus asaccharolyticus DSM 20463]